MAERPAGFPLASRWRPAGGEGVPVAACKGTEESLTTRESRAEESYWLSDRISLNDRVSRKYQRKSIE
jgi:hypothetical protein